MTKLDLKGHTYGRLFVDSYAGIDRTGIPLWNCTCTCGKTTKSRGPNLRCGGAVSCGCWKREVASARAKERKGVLNPNYRHGANCSRRETPEHVSWQSMNQRCNNSNNTSYADYGGRGISICDRWRGKDGFENFLADLGPRPKDRTLDRIDHDGNYEPSNCRWASKKDQVKNRRRYVAIQNFTTEEFLGEITRRGFSLENTISEYGMSAC